MADTPARLLTLLSLLQTPREWPGSELARRLEVSLRTVRRDVDRLRDLGYPVEASMGALGGYRLVAGTAMPPLLLEDDEAVAIAVGLRTAAGQAVTGIDEAAVRALAKLEQVLPSRLRRRVGTLSAATVPAPDAYATPVDPAQLTALASAIANRERARLRYHRAASADDGDTAGGTDDPAGRRHVEPHRLVTAGRRWYLVAYDLDREDWRTFRVDRITATEPTGARATPRTLPAPDAAAYVTDRLYALVPVYSAVATLHAPIEQVRGRIGDGPDDLEPIDANRCRLRSHTDTLEWLAFALVRLGCEFEVHEPPELRAHVIALGERLARSAR